MTIIRKDIRRLKIDVGLLLVFSAVFWAVLGAVGAWLWQR